MNNKVIGNRTEKVFLDIIAKKRGWATLIPSSQLGQPVDVVGVLNDIPFYVDIKHCEGNTFVLKNIRQNQVYSLSKINQNFKTTSNYTGFMIYFEKFKVWKFYSFENYLKDKSKNIKSIKFDDEKLRRFNYESIII